MCSLSLHVDADNAPALALYKGQGFESEALLEVGAAAGGRGGEGGTPRAHTGVVGGLHTAVVSADAACRRAAASCSSATPQDYYCRGRHAHKMRLELAA